MRRTQGPGKMIVEHSCYFLWYFICNLSRKGARQHRASLLIMQIKLYEIKIKKKTLTNKRRKLLKETYSGEMNKERNSNQTLRIDYKYCPT